MDPASMWYQGLHTMICFPVDTTFITPNWYFSWDRMLILGTTRFTRGGGPETRLRDPLYSWVSRVYGTNPRASMHFTQSDLTASSSLTISFNNSGGNKSSSGLLSFLNSAFKDPMPSVRAFHVA